MEGVEKIFELEGVWYAYPDGRAALRGVDLTLEPGEILALIGPNGAGKSTLLLALAGLLPVEGRLWYQGQPLLGLKDPRRFSIGLLFQDPDPQLFSLTVYEDVAFGPRQLGLPEEEVAQRVREALEKVGLRGFEERSPHHLSFGEKRRAALAAVLAMHPQVLLLDEPTSNLDPRARRRFIEWLSELDLPCILATHDLEMAYEIADRVALLYEGRIAVTGPPEEILLDEALLQANGLELPSFVRYLSGGLRNARENTASRLS